MKTLLAIIMSMSAFSAMAITPEHYRCVGDDSGDQRVLIQSRKEVVYIAESINSKDWTRLERGTLGSAPMSEGGYVGIYPLGGDIALYVPGNFAAFDESTPNYGKISYVNRKGERFGPNWIPKTIEEFSCELIPLGLP